METRKGVARAAGRVYAPDHMHQARGSAMPDTRYTNLYSGPADHQSRHSKLPFILAAVVILVIVVVVCIALFGGKAKESSGTVPNVPVTGLSDSGTKSDDTSTSTQSSTATAPTKSTFSYSVAQGSTSWIEVYVDGAQQVAESVVGPSTKSFDFTGTLEFVCANTTGVTATLDGADVALTPNTSGVVDTTYNFQDILAQWNAAHSSGTTSSGSSSSTTAAA